MNSRSLKLSRRTFLTGVGVSTLLGEASRRGCLEATLSALRMTTVACRGPKPMSVLRQHDVPVHIAPAEPYRTKELLDALAAEDLHDKTVAIVHYGQPNRPLVDALSARGARLEEPNLRRGNSSGILLLTMSLNAKSGRTAE